MAAILSTLQIESSTIARNEANGSGGGIAFVDVNSQSLTIRNTILAQNLDDGTASDLLFQSSSPRLVVESTLVGDNTGTSLNEAITPDANGNLIGDPLGQGLIDPRLQALASIGLTRIHPLQSSSPAINAGSNALAGSLDHDQRGVPFQRIANQRVDIGTSESQSISPSALIVTTTSDEFDFGNNLVSLREAIFVANGITGSDSIRFDATALGERPVIELQGGQWLITESVTIEADAGQTVTLDGLGHSRLFTIAEGSHDVGFRGLVLRGGETTWERAGGAAIQFLSSGTLNLERTTVTNNETHGADSPGGGIHAPLGQVALIQSKVSGNTTSGARSPGGGISSGGGLTAFQSIISANRTLGVDSHGGGLYATRSGKAEIAFSSIFDNEAIGVASTGGGIATSDIDVTVSNSTISGNVATSDGGGLATQLSPAVDLLIDFSTIGFNQSDGIGGGLQLVNPLGASATIRHSIIATNEDQGLAPDMHIVGSASGLQLESSLLGSNGGTTLAESPTPDANGNWIGDISGAGAIDPRLAPLAFRGGPTPTHALLAGSPAIDGGDGTLNTLTASDQRGTPFTRFFGAAPDIGSYETQSLNSDAFFTVTTTDDEVDALNGKVSLREAIQFASGSVGVDTIRFDDSVFALPQTISLALGELLIPDAMEIRGPGSERLTIDAGGNSRVMHVTASVGEVVISDVTLTGGSTSESGADGGGLLVSNANMTIRSSVITGNRTSGAASHGGGIYASGGSIRIIDSLISSNRTEGSQSRGGGVATESAMLSIQASAIVNNATEASGSHGGGLSFDQSVASIVNTTVSTNEVSGSDSSGGGIHVGAESQLQVVNSTITLNESVGGGGGVHVTEGLRETLTIDNTIVAGNRDDSSSPDLKPPSLPSNLSIRFSLIGDNEGTQLAESQTSDPLGNLIGSSDGQGSIDPRLGALALYGGTTPTHRPLPDSRVINAGLDDLAIDELGNALVGDQRGAPFTRFESIVDIGAFESQPAVEPIIVWPTPENIFAGTVLSIEQLNASTNTLGSFAYTPDIGTILALGDAQTLSVQFNPLDGVHYTSSSASVVINVVERSDLGDAPNSYGTRRETNGPRHLVGDLFFGAGVDADVNGSPSTDADGDGNDEDGVEWVTSLVANESSSTLATLSVNVSAQSQLDAWIDFNGNGTFDHPSEHLGGGLSIELRRSSNLIPITVPAGATSGRTYARFRVSLDGGLSPTGPADNGEVEDHALTIFDGGSSPEVDIHLPRGPITLSSDGIQLVVNRQGEELFRSPVGSVGRFALFGDASSNVVTIDSRNGNAIPVGGFSIDGDGAINTLRLLGPSQPIDMTSAGNISLSNLDAIDITDLAAQVIRIDSAAARAMDPTGGGVIIVGNGADALEIVDGPMWRMAPPVSLLGSSFSTAWINETFVQVDFASPWQNLAQFGDVNNDGNVTAGDA